MKLIEIFNDCTMLESKDEFYFCTSVVLGKSITETNLEDTLTFNEAKELIKYLNLYIAYINFCDMMGMDSLNFPQVAKFTLNGVDDEFVIIENSFFKYPMYKQAFFDEVNIAMKYSLPIASRKQDISIVNIEFLQRMTLIFQLIKIGINAKNDRVKDLN
jgi:hypothetical protein